MIKFLNKTKPLKTVSELSESYFSQYNEIKQANQDIVTSAENNKKALLEVTERSIEALNSTITNSQNEIKQADNVISNLKSLFNFNEE